MTVFMGFFFSFQILIRMAKPRKQNVKLGNNFSLSFVLLQSLHTHMPEIESYILR